MVGRFVKKQNVRFLQQQAAECHAAAFAKATAAGSTCTLSEDIVLWEDDEPLTVPAGATVTLDLAGYRLTPRRSNAIVVKGGATRGLDFLREIVSLAGTVPVYAIGGIGFRRAQLAELAAAGAAGACIRSAYMKL